MSEKITTIKSAINIYQDIERREAYLQYIRNKLNTTEEVVFFNDSYLNALCLSNVLFSRASQSISIISSPSIIYFLDVLKEPFKSAINKIQERWQDIDNKIRILVLLPFSQKNRAYDIKQSLVNIDNRVNIELKVQQPHIVLHHAIICDSKDYRLEDQHNELTEDSNATDVKARVVFNGKKASWIQNQFDVLWSEKVGQYFLEIYENKKLP